MKKIIFLILIIISCSVFSQNDSIKKVKWQTLNEAMQKNNIEKKPIFINVYARWCTYSYQMNSYTFFNDTIIDLLNDNFYSVLFNGEYRKPLEYKGETYEHYKPYGYRKPHQLTKKLLNGKVSYPTYLLMVDGEIINITSGFVKTYDMINILIYISEGIYKTKTWKEYQKELSDDLI